MKKQEDDLFLFQFGITHRHKDDDARMVVDYDRDNASDADSTGSERKRREKEAKIDEEEFSGDEEDYQEVSVSLFCEEQMMQSRKTIKHINAEEDDNNNGLCLDVTLWFSCELQKKDLSKDVDGITRFNLKDENEEGDAV